ncbi:hypothetical protein GCM10011581_12280 [Saccharopolyspora subtropica]|uniref:Uncharacterized protein n=1 Tax=Saccharopolyspora thermophila TaxID=89367 RepID=A0A917N8C9_9PSEU|nr:hypothetical protein GCM10011581_12280 [Saccharopolyspora subtropica]
MLQASPGPECGLRDRWEDVGRAFELRIGLDLGHHPEPAELLSYLPPDRYVELLTSVGMERKSGCASRAAGATSEPLLWEWERVPGNSESECVDEEKEQGALTTCLDLMEVSGLAHKHPDWSVERRRFWFITNTEDRSLGEDPEARDALGKAWARYAGQARETFRDMGAPVLVAPEIAGGFGIADLVVGDALVEVKITTRPVPPVDEWLRQVLGYLLVDWDDVLGISTLVVYAGWQGVMLTCTVKELLAAASSGTTPRLAELREEFRAAVRPDFATFIRNRKLQQQKRVLRNPRRGTQPRRGGAE